MTCLPSRRPRWPPRAAPGIPPPRAGPLGNLGNAYQELRRFEEAIGCYWESLTIFRETGDRHGESAALNNLGLVTGSRPGEPHKNPTSTRPGPPPQDPHGHGGIPRHIPALLLKSR
jgi:hypothetical protein